MPALASSLQAGQADPLTVTPDAALLWQCRWPCAADGGEPVTRSTR
jgi:hypothetical protein